jgi:membrane fusion protein
MSELFRREAVHHATRRLAGDVVLASPLSVTTLGLLLAAILFGAIAFASQATYARKSTVTGLLVPDQGTIRATVQAGGLLRTIMVHEGDPVERGQRIAVIDISAETSAGNVGAIMARGLESETTAVKAKAQAALARLSVEQQQAGIRFEKANSELAEVRIQLALQQSRLELSRQDVARVEALAAQGFSSRREIEARRSASLLSEQEASSQRRQVAAIEKDIADIQARLASIPLEMTSAEAEMQTANASIQQRSVDAEQRSVQFVIAPISGRVAALPVSTGQSISANATIAVIVPQGSQLEAELLAPSRSIGFMKPGQEVQLSLQAFPYQRFGTVPGRIRTVSTTVLAPNEVVIQGLDVKEPVYRIRITMSREIVYAYGEAVPMQPGMVVSAEIVFDRRSLLEWLFDPIYAVSRRS